MGRVILGGLLGGIVVFVWGYVSWMVLPWNQWPFRKFKSEAAVKALVSTGVEEDGVYLLPNANPDPDLSAEEKEAFQQQVQQDMESGPFLFATVRRDVPGIKADLRELALSPPDIPAAEPLFDRLGWNRILDRLSGVGVE